MMSGFYRSLAGLYFISVAIAWVSTGWGAQQTHNAPPATKAPPWSVDGQPATAEGSQGFGSAAPGQVTVRLDDPGTDDYFVHGELLLTGPDSTATLAVGPPTAGKKGGGAVKLQIRPGRQGKLQIGRQNIERAKLNESWLPFSVSVLHGRAQVQLMVAGTRPVEGELPGADSRLTLSLGDVRLRSVQVAAFAHLPKLLLPIALEPVANVRIAGPEAEPELGAALAADALPRGVRDVDGVSFCFVGRADAQAVDVSKSPRRNLRRGGPKQAVFPGLAFEVPGDQYCTLHLIAYSSARPRTAPRLAVRLGTTKGGGDNWTEQVVTVPTLQGKTDNAGGIPVRLADGTSGYLHHIRVPLAGSADLEKLDPLTVELTRDIQVPADRAAVQLMDPPSGVVVLAATMELSPIVARWSSGHYGNVFHDTEKPAFRATLTNRAEQRIEGTISARWGQSAEIEASEDRAATFRIEPGQTREDSLSVQTRDPARRRGWFFCNLEVKTKDVTLQSHHTSFAVLAPDTRKARDDSPFGVWCFWNSHTVTQDSERTERLSTLMHEGGWRWTYGGRPPGRTVAGEPEGDAVYTRLLEQYNIRFNMQYPKGAKSSGPYHGAYYQEKQFQEEVVPWLAAARKKGIDPAYLVLHENRSSKAVVVRFSEFLGGPAYTMPPEEEAKLLGQFKLAEEFCAALKKADPAAKVILINDYPSFAAEYLKRKFPAELFDILGSEGAMFSRQPERQPDWLCLLGQIQQWKRLQAAYGYNKPVWFTEALYHGTGPGRLTLDEQAVISVREAMLALAGGIERMAACGVIADSSNDYTRTDWGVAGYCFRDPECNPKPSYAMFAWLTQVLDQAKYAGHIASDSLCLHVLDFARPDGQRVYPVWVVRGQQNVVLEIAGDAAEVYDAYGNRLPTSVRNRTLDVVATDAPLYVTGTRVVRVASHRPKEIAAPAGRTVLDFDDPGQLTEAAGTSPVLEGEPTMMPRLRGKFSQTTVREDGAGALRVELLRDDDKRQLLPRYVGYGLARPIELPQRPFALTVRVKGNGAWGQIMAELVDAKGNVWTSVGSGSCETRGYPYVNFDGWHTIMLPLPGKYPAPMANTDWPANREWGFTLNPRWESAQEEDKSSRHVEYPLKLTKIFVTMRPHILYVDDEVPVSKPVILLDRLGVIDAPEGM
jgi:hypothetical protein